MADRRQLAARARIEILGERREPDRKSVGWIEQQRGAATETLPVVDVVLDESAPDFFAGKQAQDRIVSDRINVAVILAIESIDADSGLVAERRIHDGRSIVADTAVCGVLNPSLRARFELVQLRRIGDVAKNAAERAGT